jgi:hypothetical protein
VQARRSPDRRDCPRLSEVNGAAIARGDFAR